MLVWKRYLKKGAGQGGSDVIAENKKYIGQLSVYFDDCPAVRSKLNSTSYSTRSLSRLFEDYFGCKQTGPVYQKSKDKTAFEWGAVLGISIYSANIESTTYPYLGKADFDKSTNVAGGLYLNVIFPRFRGRVALYNEIFYSSFNITGKYNDVISEDNHTFYKTNIGNTFVSLNIMLRYSIPFKDNFNLFLDAGLANNMVLSETNRKYVDKTFYSDHITYNEIALMDTRKYEEGGIVGLGARYGKFSLEARYEIGIGTVSSGGVGYTSNRIFFLLGFTFPTK